MLYTIYNKISLTDLRIGNLVNRIGKPESEMYTVRGMDAVANKVYTEIVVGGVPVPLKLNAVEVGGISVEEKYFKMFSFVKEKDPEIPIRQKDYLHIKDKFVITTDILTNDYILGEFIREGLYHPLGHFKYVHQLQNIYYTKTGEELEIRKKI